MLTDFEVNLMKSVNEGQDANLVYKHKIDQIRKQLISLEADLLVHEKQQKQDPNNWGFVSDLESISDRLEEILEKLF